MGFWKSKDNTKILTSAEYESLTKKIIELSGKYEELATRVSSMLTDLSNLRGRFNQKLYKKKDNDEEVEEQSINNSIILPDNGFVFKNR